MSNKLELKNISVKSSEKVLLNDISFSVNSGEVLVIMGPNGAGKSTISNVIMNNENYEKISGKIFLDDEDISDIETNEIAKKGIFMSFQNPVEIEGVSLSNFLRTTYNQLKGTNYKLGEFHKILKEKMVLVDLDSKFRSRSVNVGFSGGEKKRSEILQLLLFEPKFAILDEIDSGLDIDSLKNIGEIIKKVKTELNTGFIIITHHTKILEYLSPDKVIILDNGRISRTGDKELVNEIIEKGFK